MQLSKASNYIYSISAIRLIETGTYERAVNIIILCYVCRKTALEYT